MQPPRLHRKALAPRTVLLLTAVMAALAFPTSALAGGFTAHLYVPNKIHAPKVGNWRIKVTANRGSQKLSGTVSYRFLFQGTVVSTTWRVVQERGLLQHADVAQALRRSHDHAASRRQDALRH